VKSVLIVEDHPLIAEIMRDFLEGWGDDFRSHVAADADATRAYLNDKRHEWFRIFLDLDVPGAYGLSLAKEIKQAGLHTSCCVVTAHKKRDLVAEVDALGFLGYVIKSSPYGQFVRAVDHALKGVRTFPDLSVAETHVSIRLTKRQEQLLDCVRRGLSSKEIAAACFLSEGTVNNAINASMRALGVTSRSHAIAKAIELGLLTMAHGDETEASGVLGRNAA
jgi:two-component system, NarL family, response regulator DesR